MFSVAPINFTNNYSIVTLGGTSVTVPSCPMVLGAVFETGIGAGNSIIINLSSQWKSVNMSAIKGAGSYTQYFDAHSLKIKRLQKLVKGV
ncbi:MAG: hypothetical protein NTX05_02760 [Fusobacteria bacterium]|nr:hypothetical protein [Fusobacteriota bacterium]